MLIQSQISYEDDYDGGDGDDNFFQVFMYKINTEKENYSLGFHKLSLVEKQLHEVYNDQLRLKKNEIIRSNDPHINK